MSETRVRHVHSGRLKVAGWLHLGTSDAHVISLLQVVYWCGEHRETPLIQSYTQEEKNENDDPDDIEQYGNNKYPSRDLHAVWNVLADLVDVGLGPR